jgi:hypothetical protein
MKIWVRSQNKEAFAAISSFFIKEYSTDGKHFAIMGTVYGNEFVCLGVYSSEMRCIQVIDEIEKLIKPLMYMANDGTGRLECINQAYYIYEMPEDKENKL